jgi:uncharacterized membrane protein YfcA
MILYIALGFFTGLIGTLTGTGGGFLLTPIFIFLFPTMSPMHLTALSLLAVFANSLSGSIGYAVRTQIHWPSVRLFALFALPGVFLGLPIVKILPRSTFEISFAVFLFLVGLFVFFRSLRKPTKKGNEFIFWNRTTKVVGSCISFFIGIISSLFGIGGGIIHVPLLSEFLRYPIHLATGTSQAILAITSGFAVINHIASKDFYQLESFVPYLIVGLILGAQLGAMFSKKIPSHLILRGLSIALFAVAIRLVLKNLV